MTTAVPAMNAPDLVAVDDGRFDWSNDESVVIPEQMPIACYLNGGGSIVIRQRRDWCETDDHFVIVERSNIANLILALENLRDEAN